MARKQAARVLGAAAALLLFAAAARAQSVHEIQAGGDAVSGEISDATDVDRVPVRLAEGALFSISLKAAKKSPLLPAITVLGVDRTPDAGAAALVVANSKGNALAIKDLAVTVPGLRWIEIRGKDGSTGGWTLTTKIKLPKGVAGAAVVEAAQTPVAFEFVCPGNAIASFTVAASKGSLAVPVFAGLKDPSGASVFVDDPIPGKKGFSLKNVELGPAGHYKLYLEDGGAPDGGVGVKIKWKIPKPLKRTLVESQIITDPVVVSVSPTGAENSQIIPASVYVAFALPGARVNFRKPPAVITVQGPSVTVNDTSISFTLNVTSFPKGVYGVEVENLDGGKHLLPAAFTVTNAAAVISSVTPGFGYDNEVRPITVTGSFINTAATAALVRGGETIPGTGVLANNSSLTAGFDLRGRTVGIWDMVVSNPDAASTSLPSAFEIRNSPPTVLSVSPSDNLSSTIVDCTITGLDLDATPSAALHLAGQTDVQGTAEAWDSSTQIRAAFDTTGLAAGAWDLVVTNPDGLSSTLSAAFRISGAVGSPASFLSPVSSADGPPAVCWNATRNQFLFGWVDTDTSGNSDVYVQRLDASGSTVGSKVSVSSSASSVPKRDVAVCWDSTNDRYLVAWVEPRSVTIPSYSPAHPSSGYTSTLQVFAQGLNASNLATVGANLQVTDHTSFPVGSSPPWYMDEFNNFRPSVCFDAKNAVFQVAFTQEWSSRNQGGYGNDDYDCIVRSADPSAATPFGTPTNIASSPNHEAEVCLAYDPGLQVVFFAYAYRDPSRPNMQIFIGQVGGTGTQVGNNSAVDLTDPFLAVDTDAKRLLLTWTATPTSGSGRTVNVFLSNTSSPGNVVGSIVTLGSGSSENHLLARSVYNPTLKEAMLAWTRIDGSSALSVRYRRATTGGSSGLSLLGVEKEASTGSGDEAIPLAAYSSQNGQSVIFWLKTMTLVNVNTYPGSTLNGIYRAKQFWIQRFQ